MTGDAAQAISKWMEFAEKIQTLQLNEYQVTTESYGQGQQRDLRLLIRLAEQEQHTPSRHYKWR